MSYETDISEALAAYKAGRLTEKEVLDTFHRLSVTDLGYARLDHDRSLRRGFPEVVYCEGKTIQQASSILSVLAARHANVLGTRASEELYEVVKETVPDAVYYPQARLIVLERESLPKNPEHKIAVITAGTSDVPIAEEAAKDEGVVEGEGEGKGEGEGDGKGEGVGEGIVERAGEGEGEAVDKGAPAEDDDFFIDDTPDEFDDDDDEDEDEEDIDEEDENEDDDE